MRIGFVHVLPLEYYPPSQSALELISQGGSRDVRVWTTENRRGMPEWKAPGVDVHRGSYPAGDSSMGSRMVGYARWHLETAKWLSRYKPDALISIEPHSALAVWMYYKLFGGSAPLFIHHHEYYSPEDFSADGMKLLRMTKSLERGHLFRRAVWISQTNDDRLRLLREWNRSIEPDAARVLPNYPPRAWIARAATFPAPRPSDRTRLVYVGSASFEDTFIREIVVWASTKPESVSLHVCGNNVNTAVWAWMRTLGASNITFDPAGVAYDKLPSLLRQFDIGLILYKGNTLNFVHIIPNKAIEYLACGLEVWYPKEMKSMRRFRDRYPEWRVREIDFAQLPTETGKTASIPVDSGRFPFTAEAALQPLLDELDRIGRGAA